MTSFLAAQAVLMASLALLPQSPQGRSAWAVLLGREPLGAIGPWEVEWLIKAVMVYLMASTWITVVILDPTRLRL